MSERLKLTYGGLLYFDRTLELLLRGKDLPRLELDYEVFDGPAGLFTRQAREAVFEVSEMSTSTFLIMQGRGDDRFVGLPLFVSRNFRHSQIYVRRDRGIERPEDLRGKRVGVFEYQMTAALWARGLLSDDFGVDPRDIDWAEGGLDKPGRVARMPIESPPGVKITEIGPADTLEQMLLDGELDALMTTRPPQYFTGEHDSVTRLFPDYERTEREYHARTGIFPIMHLVVLRRDVWERDPWVASELVSAFVAAKAAGRERMHATTGLAVSLPWLARSLEDIETGFAGDAFPYGIEPNRHVLETMTRYAHEQGLTARRLTIEELFVPGVDA